MYILEVRQQQYLPNTVNMSCAAVQEQYLHCHCEYCCAFLTCWLYDRRGQGAEGPGTWWRSTRTRTGSRRWTPWKRQNGPGKYYLFPKSHFFYLIKIIVNKSKKGIKSKGSCFVWIFKIQSVTAKHTLCLSQVTHPFGSEIFCWIRIQHTQFYTENDYTENQWNWNNCFPEGFINIVIVFLKSLSKV